jgi:hypothetical protein
VQYIFSTSFYINYTSTLKNVIDFSIFAFPIVLIQYVLKRFIDKEIRQSQLTLIGWVTSIINLSALGLFLKFLQVGHFNSANYGFIVVIITVAFLLSWGSSFFIKNITFKPSNEHDDLLDSDFTK